jgi:hypothetical protein
VLYQTSIAADPAAFARQHGIAYQAGLVRVVIDLDSPDSPLPGGSGCGKSGGWDARYGS